MTSWGTLFSWLSAEVEENEQELHQKITKSKPKNKQANKQTTDKTKQSRCFLKEHTKKKSASKLLWCLSNKWRLIQEKNQVSLPTLTMTHPVFTITYLKNFLILGEDLSGVKDSCLSKPPIAPISANRICYLCKTTFKRWMTCGSWMVSQS